MWFKAKCDICDNRGRKKDMHKVGSFTSTAISWWFCGDCYEKRGKYLEESIKEVKEWR